jgi:excisionase family DNA binding protein
VISYAIWMRLHEGQLSLLTVDTGSTEPICTEPSNAGPPQATRNDNAAESIKRARRPRRETRRSVRAAAAHRVVATDPRSVANRQPTDPAHGEPRRSRETLEKHYKTREVAELLSVHEETVLRLAQCGSLRSVRVGSERRYPESAIVEFLECNMDRTASRLRLAASSRRS